MTDPRPPLRAVPDDVDGTRTPPYNRDYERWTLGVAMTRPDHIEDLRATGLTGTAFYRPIHELTWSAILTLHVQGKPTDIVTVHDELERRGALTKPILRALGEPPMAYLAALVADAPPAANGTYYADQLVNLAATRRHLTLATRITEHPDDALDLIREHLEYEGAQPGAGEQANSWAPANLADILEHGEELQVPTHLARTDGQHLLYPAAVHSISGEPESGKTWVALIAAAQTLREDGHVTYVDFEDRAGRVIPRLLQLGAPRDAILAGFHYIRPVAALDTAGRNHLDAAADQSALAIIDGVTEAMTMHGLSLMDNEDAARYLDLLPRHLADHGCAVLQIDHVVKDPEKQGRWAIGAGHKLAGLDGAAYSIKITDPFGRGKIGRARITVNKDRPGAVREFAMGNAVGTLVIDSRSEQLHAWLEEPASTPLSDNGEMRPTHLMEKVSKYVEITPRASGKQIEDVIRGKAQYVRLAIRTLVNEGFLTVESGPRGAQLHSSTVAYREDDDANR